jgi:hypothetical protein
MLLFTEIIGEGLALQAIEALAFSRFRYFELKRFSSNHTNGVSVT